MLLSNGENVRVEMAAGTLERLLSAGLVRAEDFRCLDYNSKQCLWRLCLKSCKDSIMTNKKRGKPINNLGRICRKCIKKR